MKYTILTNTDLNVSKICLGSMTWGQQNSESEAFEQMDYAFEKGINFIDTAEMYPIPRNRDTQGLTEKYIGNWMHEKKNRNDLVIASKVTGPAPNLEYIHRDMTFSKSRLNDSLNSSLRRMKTDYIDLYQLHWPERVCNYFGTRGYTKHDHEWIDNFQESIDTLEELKREGKIRYWGLSNETPWGVMRCAEICKNCGYDLFASIQNPYNLLLRGYEIGLSEMSMRMPVHLLAYSPLAFGRLTHKYLNKTDKPEDRINQFKTLNRYNGVGSLKATELYARVAEDFGLSLAHLALSFVNSRPWVGSNIIGATDINQLQENIGSIEIEFSEEMERAVKDVYDVLPDPAC